MADDYIRKQDAVKASLEFTVEYLGGSFDEELQKGLKNNLESLEPADVVPVEMLKAEIYKLKCQQDSDNQDYYTGYMSALSTVEGILAEMGKE